ncbi:PadR family transcriptional regulator [Pseudogracilibacillus auburnensis]|uniref:PadR family transcriptional regulator PadR n=1 Tax=Pseudogracilibacillus auburnensis TaxID=1494959 RepID=A0A2V3WAM5_9BACI|nr:PadR family transcriptional regulator [Pseudogracilibacillus auburnensis]MBO1003701.1 PadR family transcriptional regulator [Pseudogracilibacillus auburnensis]PXW90288.1 PadR family transcriptional regulator PadR [Pseudogracilibacillus auburnensis]
MSIRSQLLKGILEGCILSMIKREATYGYELSLKLQAFGLTNISEGSIYPILLRLQKENLVEGEMRKSETGPRRKYYYLTEEGLKALEEFQDHWEAIKSPVDRIIKGGKAR